MADAPGGLCGYCAAGGGGWTGQGPSEPRPLGSGRNRLATDWKAVLGEEDFVGRAEVGSAWPEGYDRRTVVDAGP